MLVHRRVIPSIKFAGTHLYPWVERGTVRVKCIAQEHNAMSPARARTRTAPFEDEHTKHETPVPLTRRVRETFSHKNKINTQDLTSKEEENQHHDKSVAKVQKGGGCPSDCQLSDKEMNRV